MQERVALASFKFESRSSHNTDKQGRRFLRPPASGHPLVQGHHHHHLTTTSAHLSDAIATLVRHVLRIHTASIHASGDTLESSQLPATASDGRSFSPPPRLCPLDLIIRGALPRTTTTVRWGIWLGVSGLAIRSDWVSLLFNSGPATGAALAYRSTASARARSGGGTANGGSVVSASRSPMSK